MPFQPRELQPDRSARDLLGFEIRRYREKAGMSLRRLAEVLNYSKSHLARIEGGESLPEDDQLPSKLDTCFGTEGLFIRLYGLARKEPFPGKYRRVMEIESRALAIESYVSATVHGLLQTPEFADRWLRCGHPDAPDGEIASLVKARLDRQTRLSASRPPRCWFVLDETVLRRRVGTPEVMHHQMARLLERAAQPNITVQILPFAAGGEHPDLGGSLTLFTPPDHAQVAYVEGSRFGTIIEDRDGVVERQQSYDLFRAMALSPYDSEAMIRAAMEDWKACRPPLT
ncbi:Scr1 family TA system antitoxin-like transcriptional regulator [Streptomyces sp. NPDC021225]|uniref:helix-turn-helix domain-containing protein n=1 Tax=Streptomyces sp. NPDC021225 TaxID=3365121 RepID=UPI00378E2B5D